jgi:site-specific DNA-methyltransferase (adenine-specific)
MDVANSIWHIAPVPPDFLNHPCPFPEEIPHRLTTLYSYPGELVLDPFVGSGQTTKVAHALERRYVGYDIIEKYVELARQRIDEPLYLRQEQLIVRFKKIDIDTPTNRSRKR